MVLLLLIVLLLIVMPALLYILGWSVTRYVRKDTAHLGLPIKHEHAGETPDGGTSARA